jgi:hypothetical protein
VAKYKVLAGYHQTKEGEVYFKNDVVESHIRLDKEFPNKFRRMSVDPNATTDPDEDGEEERPLRAPKARKVKGAKKDNSDQKKDTSVKEKARSAKEARVKSARTKAKSKLKEILSKKGNLGKDVTKANPLASESSLRVYKTKEGTYNVATEDDPITPLNSKPLNKQRLVRFLADYTPPSEDGAEDHRGLH